MSTTWTNILVAIDFSDSSTPALAQAAALAALLGAQLHLSYVARSGAFIHDVTVGPDISEDFPEARQAYARLRDLQAQLSPGVDSQIHVRLSMSTQEGLLGLILELKPDLLILGSHGKGAFMRALLGSVSHQLLLQSPVPVLIVPAPGREQLLQAAPPSKAPIDGPATADGADRSAF
jgi:nucleotide-binding universal stress UspA family protein